MMKAQILKPDDNSYEKYGKSVFLAGSIEMGTAENWQERVQKELEDFMVTIYNPRRDSWNLDWEQKQTNTQFNQQVNWELNKLEKCDVIFIYFSPGTQSPISLLELGLNIKMKQMIICCPDGFWRKGNIEIVCSRYNIPLYHSMDQALGALKTILNSKGL